MTLKPLEGRRAAELFDVAAALELDHDDMHFICVLEAPKIIQIAEYLPAAPSSSILTQPTAGLPASLPEDPAQLVEVRVPEEEDFVYWFLRSPRADFEHWFQSARNYD